MIRRALLVVLPAIAFAVAVSPAESRAADDHPVVTLIKSKIKDPAKPFALIVTLKVKDGKGKELEAAARPCIAATKKEPGCIAYELNHDPEHPDTYVMYEKFKSIEAIAAHLAQKHTQTLLSTIGPLLEGGPQIKVYTSVGE
ncbi:MAG: autoinducer-2 modifying protein LsrG [Gemmataceae bacterium]|nr:autoinducer-2 modifying protein LsrG [Gemmataceae bacterium]